MLLFNLSFFTMLLYGLRQTNRTIRQTNASEKNFEIVKFIIGTFFLSGE